MIWQLRVWVNADKWSINTTISEIQKIKKAWDDIEKSLSNSADKWMKKLKKEAENNLNTIAKLNDKIWNLKKDLESEIIWWKRFKELQKEIEKTEKVLSKTVNTSWWFSWVIKNIWTWIAWFLALDKIKDLWINVLKLWANLEQSTIAFTTMLWSATKAKDLLTNLSNFASKTPFEITWIRDTAKQLLAFWFSTEEIIPTLKKLWDVSAWLSVPIEQIAYAYWQVKVAWQLMWWELMQFTNAWVPLLRELAKQFWFTEAQVKKMVENWKVWFKDVELAFQNMTSQWWTFFNMMDAQSKSLAWKWSNLKDTATQLWESIWLKVIPFFSGLLDKILSFTNNFPWLTSVITIWTIALVWLWWIVALLAPAIWWLWIAFTFLTWPIWLIIWAVSALWVWIYALSGWFSYNKQKVNELSESQKKLNEITDDYKKKVDELKKQQDELKKKFDEWTIWNKEYKESIEENKKALDKLAKSNEWIQKWQDIVNNKLLDYKEKVEALNWLKLNDSEYQKLIW
jgi:methyl-accepting chemotaxis protein